MEPVDINTTSPVTDDQRLRASAKKLTLDPLHGDIVPESRDNEAVARHVNGPAIGNIETDTEQTARAVRPSRSVLEASDDSKRRGNTTLMVLGIAGGIFAISASIFAALH